MKKIALVADTFPPTNTSAAIQLENLSRQLSMDGNKVVVFIPDETIKERIDVSVQANFEIVKIRSPKIKNISLIRRAINESLLPLVAIKNLYFKNKLIKGFDSVIFYSPSIFIWPIALLIKLKSRCKSYLILRDIFPDWALDLGLINKNLPYYYFKFIEYLMYLSADKIGVQTKSNMDYFKNFYFLKKNKLEVLHNWLSPYERENLEFSFDTNILQNKTILIYSGNMGEAQNIEIWLELADQIKDQDILFIFVGRGSKLNDLLQKKEDLGIENVIFLDELVPSKLNYLYDFCHLGIISLDKKHKINNIPGKMLSYLQSGLPIIASVNPGNEMKEIVIKNKVGRLIENESIDELREKLNEMISLIESDSNLRERCINLWKTEFSTQKAADQILDFFNC